MSIHTSVSPIRTSVVVLGGSLVGLSASLFLSHFGVPHILLEKHSGSAAHPRAMGFTETAMEHYRMVGLGDAIAQVPRDFRLKRIGVESLAGKWLDEQLWTPSEHASSDDVILSPCTGAAIAQDKLEPILRENAAKRGADLRFSHTLLDFEEHSDGVTVRVQNASGEIFEIFTDYLIACDGAKSAVRERLHIQRNGVGHLTTMQSVLFRCPDIDRYLDKGYQQFSVKNGDFFGFLTNYGDSRWVLMWSAEQKSDEQEVKSFINKALGADFAFEILSLGSWEMAGLIAETYQQGRVFLAGDAAHQLPPTRGGFGANTGIDDVWNLAWKLAWVLAEKAETALLSTYSAERRPIGWLRMEQTFSRPDYQKRAGSQFVPKPLFSDEAMEFGQRVHSQAVINHTPNLPLAALVADWAGVAGTRVPHKVLADGRSLLDLLGREFVLFSQNADWIKQAEQLGVKAYLVGKAVQFSDENAFAQAFDIDERGAVLIRPDALLAWHSGKTVQAMNLADVLKQIGVIA